MGDIGRESECGHDLSVDASFEGGRQGIKKSLWAECLRCTAGIEETGNWVSIFSLQADMQAQQLWQRGALKMVGFTAVGTCAVNLKCHTMVKMR